MKILSVRLPDELWEQLKAKGEESEIPPSVLARSYVKLGLSMSDHSGDVDQIGIPGVGEFVRVGAFDLSAMIEEMKERVGSEEFERMMAEEKDKATK